MKNLGKTLIYENTVAGGNTEFHLWGNPEYAPGVTIPDGSSITLDNIADAGARLRRFAPLLSRLFPELAAAEGLIESPLLPLPGPAIADGCPAAGLGTFWIKADHQLPVAGSIKARGGFHEVLEFAESVALKHGLVPDGASYEILAEPAARACFAQYEIAVGSTGNLGLSIGILSAALGFRATAHMSCEAKQWKKDKLRRHGVTVHEYEGDYGEAVRMGRELASRDPKAHFVDDEHSASLFSGYAVAASRLQGQLAAQGIAVDAGHPLFVYLPCGVGGAPGGVTFGLKQVFGPNVHVFFVEPADSSCFLTRMRHPDRPDISIYDVGQRNRTIADGLAVPRASELAYPLMRPLLAGIATASDARLYADLWRLHEYAGMRVEPSAAASLSGLRALLASPAGQDWLQRRGLTRHLPRAAHIAWTTGGLFVPDDEYQGFLAQGRAASRTLDARPGIAWPALSSQ